MPFLQMLIQMTWIFGIVLCSRYRPSQPTRDHDLHDGRKTLRATAAADRMARHWHRHDNCRTAIGTSAATFRTLTSFTSRIVLKIIS